MLTPWAPEIRVLLESPRFRYEGRESVLCTYMYGMYFKISVQGWLLHLHTGGGVTLARWGDEVEAYEFPTLREAYLTGSLLFPEDFLPPGH